MLHQGNRHPLQVYGPPHDLCYVRFTPNGSTGLQTITEGQGITAVNCTAAGLFTLTFAKKSQAIIPVSAQVIENDTTTYHFARVESTSASAGTAAVSHKSVAFADVATGPTASDTVDGLAFAFLTRTTV